jgi:hypothetical protein
MLLQLVSDREDYIMPLRPLHGASTVMDFNPKL